MSDSSQNDPSRKDADGTATTNELAKKNEELWPDGVIGYMCRIDFECELQMGH